VEKNEKTQLDTF